MKYIISLISFFFINILFANSSVERVNEISSLIYSYPDSAYNLAIELLADSEENYDEYGKVQSNFILAFIHDDVKGDYGKAIIYYLEAIRYAENSTYDKVIDNLISLHKNCGVIFRKFNSFELAHNYYEKALMYAQQNNDLKQIISLKYNLSGLYRDQSQNERAIEILHEILELSEPGTKKYFEILNRLSYTYFENGNLSESAFYSKKILDSNSSQFKINVYSHNILARILMSQGEFNEAKNHLLSAKQIIDENPNSFHDEKARFDLLHDLATNELNQGKSNTALSYYLAATELIPNITQNPEYFEIYKDIANLYFDQKKYSDSKKYEDLYSESLSDYLKIQREIQESDKYFNMNLITKRYFDEVEKQERIASILFYSKLISGTLLALLLFSVGYNWYQKVRMRRSIVRELVDLKIID